LEWQPLVDTVREKYVANSFTRLRKCIWSMMHLQQMPLHWGWCSLPWLPTITRGHLHKHKRARLSTSSSNSGCGAFCTSGSHAAKEKNSLTSFHPASSTFLKGYCKLRRHAGFTWAKLAANKMRRTSQCGDQLGSIQDQTDMVDTASDGGVLVYKDNTVAACSHRRRHD